MNRMREPASFALVPAPPISVVLPMYNAESFIGQALDSIADQTYRDFEALVIDDGSTDRSLEIARRHVSGDSRFRIVSRPNKGLVETLNEGVAAASGKYIFRMDSDDIAFPERFERQYDYLEAHDDCVALGTRVMLTDDALMPIVEMFRNVEHEQIDAENLRGHGSAICHPSAAMRRVALLAVGGYRKEFEWAEDLDLFLRMAEHGRLANLPDVLLRYRQHLESVGYAKGALQRERARSAVESACRRRARGAAAKGAEMLPLPADTSIASFKNETRAAAHRKWAWQALVGNHPKTARKHAFRALREDPLHVGNLRLMFCALRGY